MTTKITDKNISTIANKFVQWQSVIIADGSTATNATAGQGYFIDTTSNTHTINLPSSPSIGDSSAIKDYAGTFATNNLRSGRNGNNIQGAANNSEILTNRVNTVKNMEDMIGVYYSRNYVRKKILRLADEDIEQMEKENEEDPILQQQAEQQGAEQEMQQQQMQLQQRKADTEQV